MHIIYSICIDRRAVIQIWIGDQAKNFSILFVEISLDLDEMHPMLFNILCSR